MFAQFRASVRADAARQVAETRAAREASGQDTSKRETFREQVSRMQAEKAAPDTKIICPHCRTKGTVTTRKVTLKRGVSGGKATGALLTGGVSMLATGLSRKEATIELSCSDCAMVWHA